MLANRLRRLANIEPTLGERLVFAGDGLAATGVWKTQDVFFDRWQIMPGI